MSTHPNEKYLQGLRNGRIRPIGQRAWDATHAAANQSETESQSQQIETDSQSHNGSCGPSCEPRVVSSSSTKIHSSIEQYEIELLRAKLMTVPYDPDYQSECIPGMDHSYPVDDENAPMSPCPRCPNCGAHAEPTGWHPV